MSTKAPAGTPSRNSEINLLRRRKMLSNPARPGWIELQPYGLPKNNPYSRRITFEQSVLRREAKPKPRGEVVPVPFPKGIINLSAGGTNPGGSVCTNIDGYIGIIG